MIHQEKLLKKSYMLYVGSLSFYTTEEQIYKLFSTSRDKKTVMGLDKVKKMACGLCFMEYYCRSNKGTHLDNRIIHTDWHAGFRVGRQYGRGWSGARCWMSTYRTIKKIMQNQ